MAGLWVIESEQCRPLLSIVMPVLNEAATLRASLDALQPWMPYAELIVVDGGSRDSSVAIARHYSEAVVVTPAGRAGQMNRGAQLARGEYLLFLHSDTRLPTPPQLLPVLQSTRGWGFCPVHLSGRLPILRMIEYCMNLRSRLSAVATGDQCLFFHGALFRRLGGYADIALMEDIEICKRARQHCAPLIAPVPVETSSRRWETQGVWRTILGMWSLRLAYWLGRDPARLARRYHG